MIAGLAEELQRFLDQEDFSGAFGLLEAVRPADAADILESLTDQSLAAVVGRWAPERCAGVLGELKGDRRSGLARRIPPDGLADILDAMPPDVAVQFLEEIDPEHAGRVLGRMERREAGDVAELLDFPEDSAGRRMSQDFVSVGEHATAEEVIDRLRQIPNDVELIYYVYVLGGSEQLKGIVSLRSLITVDPSTQMFELMETHVVSVQPTLDLEEVADMVRRYNLIAIPVVDSFDRMLGVVTVDDLLETIEGEVAENLLRFAGSIEEGSGEGPRRTWPAVRRRLPWLAAATTIELVLAYVLLRPLPTALLVVVVSYIPLMLFLGANTSVHAAARVLARITSGRIDTPGLWGQARREVEAGLILGLLAGLSAFPLLALIGEGLQFAAVVAPAVALTVLAGAGVGAALPIFLHKIRLDPSIVSGPLLGSAMDIISLGIYIGLATTFSHAIL